MIFMSVILILAGCGDTPSDEPKQENTETTDQGTEIETYGKDTVISEAELRQKFPEYFDLDTFKGLEVYVWKTEDGAYRCGVLTGTNRLKTEDELNALKGNGATVEEMKVILASYGIEKGNISILPHDIQSLSPGEYSEGVFRELRALFEDCLTDNTSPTENTADFSEYLDIEKFVQGLSQRDFISLMGKYSYEGIPLSEGMGLMHYDGPDGGGCQAVDKYFGFSNDYTVAEDEKTATYSNRFYTGIPLDGLTLPYGITFDDDLSAVLQKLDFNIDPEKDFASDMENAGTMTLQRDDGVSLTLINCLLLPGLSGKPLFDYELRYTEKYQATRSDGVLADVTRSVILSFTDENNKLGKFEMSVCEVYELQ